MLVILAMQIPNLVSLGLSMSSMGFMIGDLSSYILDEVQLDIKILGVSLGRFVFVIWVVLSMFWM
jgi:hypothetical protein